MEVQFGLFDDIPNAPRPVEQPGAGVANRNQHYHESKPRHSTQRAQVLRHITNMHNIGATREEIADALSKPLASICGRVNELLECGDVIETAERRPTRAGKSAVVLVAKVNE